MTHGLQLKVTRTKDGIMVAEGDNWTEAVTVEHALHHFVKKYGEVYGLEIPTEYAVVLPLKEK